MSYSQKVHLVIATDFEIEPVIEQYLATYPDSLPREYEIVYRTRNEHVEGDYCYIIVYQYTTQGKVVKLDEFLKSYCVTNNKVFTGSAHEFPSITSPRYGDGSKYRKKK